MNLLFEGVLVGLRVVLPKGPSKSSTVEPACSEGRRFTEMPAMWYSLHLFPGSFGTKIELCRCGFCKFDDEDCENNHNADGNYTRLLITFDQNVSVRSTLPNASPETSFFHK